MDQISEHVFIEDEFPGVVLGALNLPHGLVMVDAPLQGSDVAAWRGRLANLGGGVDKLLVLLDTHLDRSYQVHSMGANIICHANTAEIVELRATTSHSQDNKTGALWEMHNIPLESHALIPDFTYSDKASIYWNGDPLLITHHPGAHLAGSWLLYEPEKIVFVGDSVVRGQPPFLGWSDLDVWLDDLTLLQSDAFADYQIISGRSGIVSQEDVNRMIDFLLAARNEIQGLNYQKKRDEAFHNAVDQLLDQIGYDPIYKEHHRQRLQWGLSQYLQRHPSSDNNETD